MTQETPLQLFHRHIGIAGHVMSQRCFQSRILPSHCDSDDMYQVALMGLWAACQGGFDSSVASFSTYAAASISNAINEWIRRGTKTQRYGDGRRHVSLDASIGYVLGEVDDRPRCLGDMLPSREPSPDEAMMRSESRLEAERIINTATKSKTRAVLRRRYLDGASYAEIAEEFSYASQKSASEVILKTVHLLRGKQCRNDNVNSKRAVSATVAPGRAASI